MLTWIFQDWEANRGNFRSQLVLAMFRLAQLCHRLPRPLRWLGWPYLALYHLAVSWELGIEIPASARIGPGLRLYHGTGLVIHKNAVMGKGCILRHNVTIGNRHHEDDVPTIGDEVEIGAQAILIGAIRIGNGARIGAGAVVLQDVPEGATAAGNPARIIAKRPAGSKAE